MMRSIFPGNAGMLYRILIPVAMFDVLEDSLSIIQPKFEDSNINSFKLKMLD